LGKGSGVKDEIFSLEKQEAIAIAHHLTIKKMEEDEEENGVK
jgi:hypothetical protein